MVPTVKPNRDQDPRFLLVFRGRVGVGFVYKTHIPMTSAGKGGICSDQMIPWLPVIPYLLGYVKVARLAPEGWLQSPGLSELAN